MTIRSDAAPYVGEATYTAWPVSWTAVWVGMLTAIAVGLVIGLAGLALGMQQQEDLPTGRMGMGTLIFAVLGAFFSFVAGGWVAAKIAGIWRAETATLHGAIVWLVAVPVLILIASLGAGSLYGAWLGGL